DSLRYAGSKGGSIVMHGYTHQYNSMPNIYTAVSGDDFEFWNAVAGKPVAEDSETWTLSRLDSGLSEFRGSGFSAYAWEPPHYQASPLAYQTFLKRFSYTYQRVVYYNTTNPNLDPSNPDRDIMAGMFYPYFIN